ncbi:MAG: hypothetical protein K6T91_04920 [Firmicutes bacterium]|nr:hypothetical protein [Bacillota bacterium]
MHRESREKNKIFGLAGDFYRVRVLKVNEELPADLEWREDILYREPKTYEGKLKVSYRIQIVTQDKKIHEIANITNRRAAKSRLRRIKEHLRDLTKMEFDKKYKIHDTCECRKNAIVSSNELVNNAIYFVGVKDTSKANHVV